MRSSLIIVLTAAVLAAGALAGRSALAGQAATGGNDRLQRLEDREAIRAVMAEYGRTLDARDFAGFAQLFARDAEFAGGTASAKGRDEIGALLGRLIQTNYPDSQGKNLHLFTNETIDVSGDTATAVSKGAFVGSRTTNQPELLQLATYRDQFVREDGRWKFKRRQILAPSPSPAVR
jgi:uncharacterized protein (TIGR02246 family)